MKKWLYSYMASLALLSMSSLSAETSAPAKIGVVNFKMCVEESKIGKQEQAAFEAMKKQMEKVLEEKEKVLSELANKLNNVDELELMSPEAETDLKRKFRALSQEMTQMQSQFYQTLNQANFQVVQKLSELVGKASEIVAKSLKLDLIFNDETLFYANPERDISASVIKQLDANFEETPKPAPAA